MIKSTLVTALFLVFAIPALADDTPEQQWAKLPPEKKEEIRKNYHTYQNMSPDEKAEIDQKYDTYKTLPPQEKERLYKNWEAFKKLPTARQQRIKQKAQRYAIKHGNGELRRPPKKRRHKKG